MVELEAPGQRMFYHIGGKSIFVKVPNGEWVVRGQPSAAGADVVHALSPAEWGNVSKLHVQGIVYWSEYHGNDDWMVETITLGELVELVE